MKDGIHSALSGALVQQKKLDTIANNLANINTPGFKRDRTVVREFVTVLEGKNNEDINVPRTQFSPTDFHHLHGNDLSYATVDGTYTDFSQGIVKRTGAPLDLAVQGKGFFEVLTPIGVRYTRSGHFTIGPDGTLMTLSGYKVLSRARDERSAAEPKKRVIRMGTGPVNVDRGGRISQAGRDVASVSMVEFASPTLLTKVGSTLFANNLSVNVASPAERSEVLQGFVEDSNVNGIREMTDMISTTRLFEGTMKAIRSIDTINDKLANEVGRM